MADKKSKITADRNFFSKNVWFWVVVGAVVIIFSDKATLFLLLFLFSILVLIIGLANPNVFKKIIKKPTRKKVGLYCGSALILFLILFIAYSPTPQSSVKKEEQAHPTKTTEQKEDTKTATPEPTETPRDQLSKEEKDYCTEMGQQATDIGKTIGEVGSFLSNNSNMFAWTDNEKMSLVVNMAIVQNGYAQAKKISPPDKFREVHSIYLEATKKYYDAMTSLADGIDNIDPDKIDEAGDLMAEGSKLIEEAASRIKELTP